MAKQEKTNQNNTLLKQILYVTAFIVVFGIVSTIVKTFFSPTDNINNYSQTGDWIEYNATTGNFKILFPAFPKQEVQNLEATNDTPAMEYTGYTSDGENGDIYFAGVVEYPSSIDTSVPKTNLNNVVNGAVAGTNGQLISSNFSEFNGRTSVDYVIEAESGQIKYKSFLIGQTLYTLGMGSPNSDFTDFDKFASSFQLISQ